MSGINNDDLDLTPLATETTLSTQSTRIGDVAETAPATDTSSSGLNGRLQRIAQRITSLLTATSDGTQRTQITNGTNNAAVTNTSPLSSDYGIVVRPVSLELPTFSVVAANVAVTNNKSMLAIQNTGTSVVRIREIWLINDRNTAVTGISAIFQALRITSFTGGTALTINSYDTTDTLPSGITAATKATVSGEGALLRQGAWSTDEWGPGTLDTESLDHAIQQTEPFWKQTTNGKALTIRQNQGIHLKFATNSTAGEFNVRFVFTTE